MTKKGQTPFFDLCCTMDHRRQWIGLSSALSFSIVELGTTNQSQLRFRKLCMSQELKNLSCIKIMKDHCSWSMYELATLTCALLVSRLNIV